MKKYRSLLLLAFAVIATAPLLSATTINAIKLICPACGKPVIGDVVMSTNNFGGQDRDFLTRAAGQQPVLIFPITCSHCFYSGFRPDFSSKLKLSEKIKDKFVKERRLKPLRPIKAGMASRQIIPWVRYDLIAQTYTLLDKKPLMITDQYLRASWAVRLTAMPISVLDAPTAKKVHEVATVFFKSQKQNRRKIANIALYEIKLGRQLYQKAKTAQGEDRLLMTLAAIHLLRYHGENSWVNQCLPLLQTAMTSKRYQKFVVPLQESIAQERTFQRQALRGFDQAAKLEKEPNLQTVFLYLCGEMCRRLEQWEKSRDYYAQAAQNPQKAPWLEKYIKEQQQLLPAAKPSPLPDDKK